MKKVDIFKLIGISLSLLLGVGFAFGILPKMLSAANDGLVIGAIALAVFVVTIVGGVIWNKFIAKTLPLIAIAMFSACSIETVPSGNVGIKVYLLGGDKGVDHEPVGVGRYFLGINEQLYLFPTFTQNYVWTRDPDETGTQDESITFQTREGMEVNADIGISYAIEPTQVSLVFQKYRRGVDEITDVFLRNMVRDSLSATASTMAVEDVYGEKKQLLIENVQKHVYKQVRSIGINIERIYLIGSFRLPKAVTESLNSKIEATQKALQAENEVQRTIAEANKAREQAKGEADSILIKATAEAEAIKMLNYALTQNVVQYEATKRWNGVLPQVTGGATPMIDLRTK